MTTNIKFLATTAVSALALMGLAAPASAQDAVAGTFTGPRVEGIVGYDISRAGSDVDNDTNTNDDQSIEGILYGVGIGYDFDFQGLVVGAEAEYAGSTADTEVNNGDFEGFGFGSVETGGDLYLGLRAGARVGERGLVYVKGGYTNLEYNIEAGDLTRSFRTDLDVDGWRLGAGAEYAMTERSFVKLEYRYSNYSEGELDFPEDVPDSERFGVDLDRHQIVVGAGFRF